MDTQHITAYVEKAKSYGNRVLIASTDRDISELEKLILAEGLKVRHIDTYDIILSQNPEHREPLIWADTVIFFGHTVQVDSGLAFNLICEKSIQEHLPHEVFDAGKWQQHSMSKIANFHMQVESWNEVIKIWPELVYSEKVNEIAMIYAGAESGISVGHICTSELVDYVRMLQKTGAKKFLCYNLMETIQLDSILRIQLLATAMPDIDPANFIYVTSASNMLDGWKTFCFNNQIQNPVSIMSGNWYDQTWWNTSWMPSEDSVQVPPFEPDYVPSKTFLCFNNVPRWHRTKLVTELVHNDLLKDGLVSLRNNRDIHFDELGLDKTRPEATQWLKDNIPLSIDDTDARETHIAFPDQLDVELHRDTCFSLVTETIYQSDDQLPLDNSTDFLRGGIFFTEKTYKPMWFNQAFIVLAVPGMLKYLKTIGWQTFHPYIDESYDRETDDQKRLEMVVAEVKRLNSFTEEEWRRWRKGIEPCIMANAMKIRREHSGDLTTSPWRELF